MSANVTFDYDDGSSITWFNVSDNTTDDIADYYLYPYKFSHKV